MYTVQRWIQQGSGGSDPHTSLPPNLEFSMYMLKVVKQHAVLDVNIVEE
jgi:hypothetical protein